AAPVGEPARAAQRDSGRRSGLPHHHCDGGHPQKAGDGREIARRAFARHGEDVLQRRGRRGISVVIVTRTPFRVTLGGGGTDLSSYYASHGGFIFAMGLDKYM